MMNKIFTVLLPLQLLYSVSSFAMPHWKDLTIDLGEAKVGAPLAIDLKQFVDASDSTIHFSKIGGPAWVLVSIDGHLTGTPDYAGEYSMVLSVRDGEGGAFTSAKLVVLE